MLASLSRLRLRHQVLLALALVTGLAMLLLLRAASGRLSEAAQANSQRWASTVAESAAATAAERLGQGDEAGLQQALRGLASMPGMRRIDVLDGQGHGLLTLEVNAQRRVVSHWRTAAAAASSPGSGDGSDTQVWAPIGPGGVLGSVGVAVSAEADLAQLQRLRYDSVLAVALAGLLGLVVAHLVLARAQVPLQRVTQFARDLVTQSGNRIQAQGSREIGRLGEALNHASQVLRTQLDALHASDLRTQCIVNAVPDAIIGVDGAGRILTASPAVASIFGREPAALVGQPLGELVPGLDAEAAEQRTLQGLYMRASRTHVTRFEAEALRHGGTRFPVEVSLARVESDDESGQGSSQMRYTCAVRDVTDQRMLDGMLNLYVRALECSSNGVVISDMSLPGHPMIFANAAFYRITGYEPGHAIGRDWSFLLREDTAQPEIEAMRRAIAEGRSHTVVLRNYRADGSLFFSEFSTAPVQGGDGPPRHYVGIINDVTERERSRLAVAERNARLNAVFDLSPDGFVVFDREHELVYVNRAFLLMTGLEPGIATEGLSLDDFEARMQALVDPAYAYPPLSRLACGGGDDDGFETMDLLHLRQPRQRVLTRLARHNAGGQGESILYFRDVTHENEVDRMKSEFLTTAAHELRTPMVSVFGFTELLLKRPVAEERRRDVLETIHRQASLLITMINDLLDLARIESRQGRDLHRERSVVSEMVADTVARMAGAAAGHELRVALRPEHAALALWVDPTKTSQALTNVLSNAIKYSGTGTLVQVSSRTHPEHPERLGLVVRDQGVGMSQAQLARVFERFYRADPSGNIPGTGLGMSLVKEIVEQQDGQIEITSHAGLGTEVTLWLPLATRHADIEA